MMAGCLPLAHRPEAASSARGRAMDQESNGRFLVAVDLGRTSCLILDSAMPVMSGPELHRELHRRGQPIPVVFITAHGDDTVRPRLLEQGAVACLFKPFSETALLAALDSALRVA